MSEKVNILGVDISRIEMNTLLAASEEFIKSKEPHMICVSNVHTLIVAQKDEEFKKITNSAGITIPDGMPLVWVSHLLGKPIPGRITGADFLDMLSQIGARKRYTYFLMGGDRNVAKKMAENLERKYSGLKVAGIYSPPYGEFSRGENEKIITMIKNAKPDVLWVGMTAPKQEKWIWDNFHALNVPLMVGVGAAFNFFAGTIKRAPFWMQHSGLEWLYRLFAEPKRLWRRYLVKDISFFPLVLKQLIQEKKRQERGNTGISR